MGSQRFEAGEELDPLLLEGPPRKHEKEREQPCGENPCPLLLATWEWVLQPDSHQELNLGNNLMSWKQILPWSLEDNAQPHPADPGFRPLRPEWRTSACLTPDC